MSVPADKVIPPPAPVTPTKEEKLEKILKAFEAGDTKTDHPGKNLRELLEKSPDLKARILDSVDKGHLEKFALLPAGANAGGTYSPDTKTIELPREFLKKADKDKAAASELVFVMGHEIQHSFNSTVSDKATDAFVKGVETIAKGPGPHDYTSTVKTLIQNYREDEAGAHIGGFNAVSSQVLKNNPKAGLKELYNENPGRMGDFIERGGKAPAFTYALKPGLTIEADMTLKSSAENVKAMGKHYFDQPPSSARLGTKGNQDYPNYYGEWAVNVIKDFEKQALADAKKLDPKAVAPEVKLNLKEIGLDKALLDTTLKYTDTSPKKPISLAPGQLDAEAHAAPAKAEPALYGQAVRALERLGADAGVSGEGLHNVAASMASKADKAGMTEISGAIKGNGSGVIAFQGDPAIDQVKRITVDVETEKMKPAAKTLGDMGNGSDLAAVVSVQPQRGQVM